MTTTDIFQEVAEAAQHRYLADHFQELKACGCTLADIRAAVDDRPNVFEVECQCHCGRMPQTYEWLYRNGRVTLEEL